MTCMELGNQMGLMLAIALLMFSSVLQQAASTASHTTYNAIFNFGDAFSDTGNFIVLAPTLLAIGNPPYGETFFQRPTGRASDGRLVLDFIAEAIPLPLVPPYLGQNKDFSKGANFAVARSTALPFTFYQQNNLTNGGGLPLFNTSLSVQLEWSLNVKQILCNTTDVCNLYLNNSLFLLGTIGFSDYTTMIGGGKTLDFVNNQVPAIIGSITTAAQFLLNQGVRHLVMPGVIPIGCIPRVLTLYASPNVSDYDSIGCLRPYNSISEYHNKLLRSAVVQLQVQFPRATISYADYYKPIVQFLTSPRLYGFTVLNGSALIPCCGGGGPYNYNTSALCGQAGASACPDPTTVIWNGYGFTEKLNSIIADGWLNGPYAIPPIL